MDAQMTEEPHENPGLKTGWACFHCWDFFPPTNEGVEAAQDHFGETPDGLPLCKIAQAPARKLARRVRLAEAKLIEVIQADEPNGYALWGFKGALMSKFHTDSPAEAWSKYEQMQGRAESAEAALKVLRDRFPGVVARAFAAVEDGVPIDKTDPAKVKLYG
jgi:hypothetical protein